MKVYRSVDEIPSIKNPVVTLGTYDGVHLGHQEIISFLKKNAKRTGGETVLFTFHPHPRMVLYPEDHGMKLIQLMSVLKNLSDSELIILFFFLLLKNSRGFLLLNSSGIFWLIN
jgi:riboflavin kinase/FMN adenylyltransferase